MAQLVETEATSSSLTCSIPGDSFPKEYEPSTEEPEVSTGSSKFL